MKSIKIVPGTLNGEISPPPSKSICHRAIIASALASGQSIIENITLSEDISATAAGVQALGAKIDFLDTKAAVHGGLFTESKHAIIDCKESGSTLRFLMPIGLLSNHSITYSGKGKLGQRPMEPYLDIFRDQGIQYSSETLPMTISGSLNPGLFRLKGNISSQFLTGLMFALPLLSSDSVIELTTKLESKAYVDLTIDVLEHFGIEILKDQSKYLIKGNQQYKPANYIVEADYSQAAFWLAAGSLAGDIVCKDLNKGSRQGDSIIVEILKNAGADICREHNSIHVRRSTLQAFQVDVSQCPDIAPILAVVAALSRGTSYIYGAARLRYKECDRLTAITKELTKLGAKIKEDSDSMTITGVDSLAGGEVNSWGDHRIAMALAIAALRCKEPVIINDSAAVNKSYPNFFIDYQRLGGILNECNLG